MKNNGIKTSKHFLLYLIFLQNNCYHTYSSTLCTNPAYEIQQKWYQLSIHPILRASKDQAQLFTKICLFYSCLWMSAVHCMFVAMLHDITFPWDKDRLISVWTKYVLSSPFPFTFIIPLHVHIQPNVCKIRLVSSVTCKHTCTQRN